MAHEPLSDDDACGMVARLRDAVVAHVVHGGNGAATGDVLDAISSRCYGGPHAVLNRDAIGGTPGGIEGVLAAMASHLGVAVVQWRGMWALDVLATDHATNQERIGDTPGALDGIVAGMRAHADAVDVQDFGMAALHILASNHVGNQHRMRASPQLLRLVASAADDGDDDDDDDVRDIAEELLEDLGLSPAQARAAAAKVGCHHSPPPSHTTHRHPTSAHTRARTRKHTDVA